MAAPNIVNVTSIYGKTNVATLSTVTSTVVTNAAASGKVFKVNTILVTNMNGANNAAVNVDVYRSTTSYNVAYLMTVPAGATLDLMTKSIYLEEGDAIRMTASANSHLQGIISFEELS